MLCSALRSVGAVGQRSVSRQLAIQLAVSSRRFKSHDAASTIASFLSSKKGAETDRRKGGDAKGSNRLKKVSYGDSQARSPQPQKSHANPSAQDVQKTQSKIGSQSGQSRQNKQRSSPPRNIQRSRSGSKNPSDHNAAPAVEMDVDVEKAPSVTLTALGKKSKHGKHHKTGKQVHPEHSAESTRGSADGRTGKANHVEKDTPTANPKQEKPKPKHEVKEIEQAKPVISIPNFVSISNLSHILKIRLKELQDRMKKQGFDDVGANFIIDAETASLVAEEFGFDIVVNDHHGADIFPAPADPEDPINAKLKYLPRPPIVTIMGHVDHGKTTILDYLRKSSIVASEHGGITQHIGAFLVKLKGANSKSICFLDTPGHAAFLNMRQRGAQVTDIVVLVVAADDSVMPQTIEAIKHAKQAEVPMIVAVNKIDKPQANPEKVIADLARYEVDVESYGGDTQVVPVSGLTGQGIDTLEESIVTLSEVLELKAPFGDANCEGWVLESQMKKGVGAAASVIVKRGLLKPGMFVVAGESWCKVKSLKDENGKIVKSAGPGTPVEVLGWKSLPEAGDEVLQAQNEAQAKQVAQNRIDREQQLKEAKDIAVINEKRKKIAQEQEAAEIREERLKRGLSITEEQEVNDKETKKILRYIIKSDVSGSAEAVEDALQGLENEDAKVEILYSNVGSPTESDLARAEVGAATILCFNVKCEKDVLSKAAQKHVEIVSHNIIYRLLEDITQRLQNELKPEIRHKVLGEATVRAIFEITQKKSSKKTRVAGCRVTNGLLTRSSLVKVMRNGDIVFDGTLASIKHHKDEVNEAKKDSECGLTFASWDKFEEGDTLQTYQEIVVKRS